MKNREKRNAVRLPARMRSGTGWSDVEIRNVSARGMMLCGDAAPTPGSYLEVQRDAVVVIGRIVWRNGRHFGVRAQDFIDLAALIDPSRVPAVEAKDATAVEHRHLVRPLIADRRQHGRMLQFLFLLVGIGVAATIAGEVVQAALAPLTEIEMRLVGD